MGKGNLFIIVLGTVILGSAVLTAGWIALNYQTWPRSGTVATTPPAAPSGPDRFDAQVICEKFVRNELKAPSTAKFAGPSETTANNAGATWTVRGWVDSQNGFGAQIRSNYECRATFTGRSGGDLFWNREALSITAR